jgi:hypothetical protein
MESGYSHPKWGRIFGISRAGELELSTEKWGTRRNLILSQSAEFNSKRLLLVSNQEFSVIRRFLSTAANANYPASSTPCYPMGTSSRERRRHLVLSSWLSMSARTARANTLPRYWEV